MTEDSGKHTREERKELGKRVMTRRRGEEGMWGHRKDSNRQSQYECERRMYIEISLIEIMLWYYHTLLSYLLVQGHRRAAPLVVSCMYANMWTINTDTLTCFDYFPTIYYAQWDFWKNKKISDTLPLRNVQKALMHCHCIILWGENHCQWPIAL